MQDPDVEPDDEVSHDRLYEWLLVGTLLFFIAEIIYFYPITVFVMIPVAIVIFFGPRLWKSK